MCFDAGFPPLPITGRRLGGPVLCPAIDPQHNWTLPTQRACHLTRAVAGTDLFLGRRLLRSRHIGLRPLRQLQTTDATLDECLVQGLSQHPAFELPSQSTVADSTVRRCPFSNL